MSRERRSFLTALLWACVTPGTLAAGIDPDTGLVTEPGWEDVRAHCGTCHSFALVTRQRADRPTWLSMIRWMQDTQNLWALPAEVEGRILDYLADHYPPGAGHRRPPIAPELMPWHKDRRER